MVPTGPAQAATVDPAAYYVLTSRHSGKAVDVYNLATTDGAPIVQWARNDGNQQQWQFVAVGSGYYQVRSRHSGKVLQIASAADGAELTQQASSSDTRQHFALADSPDGYVRLVNRLSGKALDVWEWSTTDGGRISQFADLGGTNQQWQLVQIGNTGGPPAGSIVVAADGSGQHRTVQSAIDAAPANSASVVTIAIRPGTYRGVVSVPSNKTNLHLLGLGTAPGNVVIVENHSAGTQRPDGSTYGTNGSATATVTGRGFSATNLTISNDFDEVANAGQAGHQAVALYLNSDRSVLTNVRLLGDQDTFLIGATARSYLRNSYVEGTVDFIFGDGIAVLHSTQVHEKRSTGGPVTAARTPASRAYGFLFYRCNLTSSAAAGSSSLGRPWGPDAQVLYRESTLGAHINTAQPWTNMSSNTWQNARFSEYRNNGAGAGVNGNRPQLSDAQAPTYTPQRYLAGSDGWNPVS
ncbi:pectinesterase family protein [Plantactinospora soyae]|uniref:Pectinesterase n=1 Tax=Plantactinospora soyae TaxID=1544732 RepID=A0A927R9S4_9ACTN|nr:pectinesterase family protein [Plantactinospora soyae]MBE1491714.1 pectinesterase [Plantactinospora soyae]